MHRLDHVGEAADHPAVHGIARDALLGLCRHGPDRKSGLVLVVRPSSRQDDIGEKPVRREHCSQRDRDVPAFHGVTSGRLPSLAARISCAARTSRMTLAAVAIRQGDGVKRFGCRGNGIRFVVRADLR
jgi:hypothetical protein